MPQISLEYTSNIQFPIDKMLFFRELHKIVSEKGKCNIDNCKSRLKQIDNYFIGNVNNDELGFIHLELRFLEGRSDEIKIKLGNSLLSYLEMIFINTIGEQEVQITVQVIDIKKIFYFKYPKGTYTELK